MWELIIENEKDSAGIVEVIEILMDHPPKTKRGNRFYKFLVQRQVEWERGRYGLSHPTPGGTLNEMILSNGYDPGLTALVNIFGSPRQVWLATQDQTPITPDQAAKLADFFHTSPTLFLAEPEEEDETEDEPKTTENLDHESIPDDVKPPSNTD